MKLSITDKDRERKVTKDYIRPISELNLIDFFYSENDITISDLKLLVDEIENAFGSEYKLEVSTTYDGIDGINYFKEVIETDEEYENRIKELEKNIEKNKVKHSEKVKKITKEKFKEREQLYKKLKILEDEIEELGR